MMYYRQDVTSGLAQRALEENQEALQLLLLRPARQEQVLHRGGVSERAGARGDGAGGAGDGGEVPHCGGKGGRKVPRAANQDCPMEQRAEEAEVVGEPE